MFKKIYALLLSVFIHLIVMYVVAQSVMFASKPDSPQKGHNIIQATLLFDLPSPPPKALVEVPKVESPEPVEPEKKRAVEEKPVNSQIAPISVPEARPISIPPKLEEVQEASGQHNEENVITIIEKNITPTPSSKMRTPATNMAKRHLSSFQQQQRNKLAKQASRYYQQHKNSPVINSEVKNPFMTEDEKPIGSLRVRADCSSTSKKTTAVLLSFLGGQIDCSRPPPISGFIQNRMNKGYFLSGKNRQKEEKKSQPIIIKD
ncbi:MAG: hypothetical protein ACJAV1_001165 [Paraglaciecola sp.]